MNLIKSFVLAFISISLFFSWLAESFAASFPELETQIHSWLKDKKIRKMQLAMRDFWLYDWEIDWKYSSTKKALLDYQRKTWLIKKETDYWAWYFGIKTLTALQEDFPDNFDEITKKYLIMDQPDTNIRYFYVTAYYSPLPWQRRYTTWSYRWDIRLNWWWKLTASKKKVFNWVLAAPRNYRYGTKIELEWIWVWVVEDRWWAIVNSWERWFEYDRIDVWMWYWDEWLIRALKWWKRKVKWKVVPNTREISIEFDESPVVKYNGLTLNAEKPKKQNVVKVQQLLKELKLYNWKVDWKFSSVKSSLVRYQVANNVISSSRSPSAWYFGKRTYAALRQDFGWWIFKKKDNKLDEDVILTKELREQLKKVSNKINSIVVKKYWSHDSSLAIKYKRNLRKAIDTHSKKVKDELKKRQLKYLKSII